MPFTVPVEFVGYNGKKYVAAMTFEHSAEREFAMTVNKRAIDECSSLEQLKPVAKNLLEGWSMMNTALQNIMLENIQLRQALAKREIDLYAAEELLKEAGETVQRYAKQSTKTKQRLWPW